MMTTNSYLIKQHPAKYNDVLLPLFEELLVGSNRVLDPFAGTGKLRQVMNGSLMVLNELEPEWAIQGPSDTIADTLHLPYADASFDAICTSPTYGNRMADHHNAIAHGDPNHGDESHQRTE